MVPRVLALSVLSSLLACSASRPPEPKQQRGRDPEDRGDYAPGVVIPTALGEGHGDDEPKLSELPTAPVGGTGGASALSASAGSGATPGGGAATAGAANENRLALHDPPDPPALRLADQWEYELEMKGGKLNVLSTEPRHFKQPVVTARRFGRYAIELWIGKELVDRVRFDLPGLAPEAPEPPAEKRQPLYGPSSYARGVEVRQKVLVPAAPRARQARLIDRATGEISPLPWPPKAPSEGAGGAAAAAPTASATAARPAPPAASAKAAPRTPAPPAPSR